MTDLRRHVPAVALTWDDEAPGALHRVVDGTLVFADISGFTALTERLAKQGRIGAEELIETLNRVFGAMLRQAQARGGELLKFGGDALLFLFRGEGHAMRACEAAVEMRIALREAATVPTSVGRLRLSMSVGIHSGDVLLFLVGNPTRELLVLGPAATLTAESEKAAEAGEIVVSPDTAARLPAGATRPRADGRLLFRWRRPRSAAPAPAPQPDVGTERLRMLFPPALGDYLAPRVPDPEHRVACIAFVRFSGTDARLAERGPAALAETLDRVLSASMAALDAEGVTLLATDLDTDGFKLFLGSGVPQATEDDEGRMLRALRRIADSRPELPIQIGVNRGHVFAAEVGTPERAAYSAMGDTTNTAARIMSKAPAGALFAHPAVLESSRTLFATEPAGPFAMKGKAVPLLVYRVGEEAGTRVAGADSPRARLPFLGRDAELAVVRRPLARAHEGEGRVVTVTGATGMGKSRLVREALEGSDARLVVLRSEPYGASSSYRMMRDPVRALLSVTRGNPEAMGEQLLATLGRSAPELLPMAPLLADVVQADVAATPESDAVEARFRPDRLADILVRLLDVMMPGPLVILVEEAHWADEASSHVLGRLAVAVAGRPWALVVVRRDEPTGFVPASGTAVALAPLPEKVVERLVIAATEATPLRPHEVAAIVARAEGNPLYVEEVSRVVSERGSADEIPQSLQGVTAARIDALDPHARRILRYASVIGRSFRREVLNETLATDGLAVDAATLAALAQFLVPDGPDRLRFRTSLARNAAYEGLAYRIRARLHRTAGSTLERLSTDLDSDAAMLSLHFAHGGEPARTWRYARMAGERARRAYANVDAAAQFERALEAARHLPGVPDAERIEAWTVLGELRELSGQLDASLEAYGHGLRLAPRGSVTRADLLFRRARVRERADSFRSALRDITAARRLLDGLPSDMAGREADLVRVRLDTLTSRVRLSQERPRQAKEWAQRAADGAVAAGDSESLVRALIAIDHAAMLMGEQGLGEPTRRALAICVERGDVIQESVTRGNLGVFAFYAGRWSEAVEWYSSSREAAVRGGNDFGAAETDVNLGELLVNLGRLDEAESLLTDAVRVLRASGMALMASLGETQIARLHLARGEWEQAEAGASRASAELLEAGYTAEALEADLVRAQVAVATGRAGHALEIVDRAREAATEVVGAVEPRVHLRRSEALLALGRPDECAASIEKGLESAREQSVPFEEALLLELRSKLRDSRGVRDAADRDAADSRRILAGLGFSFEVPTPQVPEDGH